MKIAINDANILIDLMKFDLYEKQSDYIFKKEEPTKQLTEYEEELQKHRKQFEKFFR